jgi:hypothetical protein
VPIINFDNYVLIEQLRALESNAELDGQHVEFHEPDDALSFDARLLRRAKDLVERNDLSDRLQRAEKYTHRARWLLYLLATFLGALGTLYAVTGTQTINIYWLLLVLLGFNALSMLLWLAGVSFNLPALVSSWFAWFPQWFATKANREAATNTAADRAWLACHYGGKVGKWQLSKLTHEFWLVYLIAGLLILVIQLMTRQYDFVWGTTLLSDNVFVRLTAWMGEPLQFIGMSTPSAAQVWETRIGVSETLTAAHRFNWAQFLLGAIILYGVLPRLLLWLGSISLRKLARHQFRLDYYHPYYINLQQQLVPMASHGQIVDADEYPPVAFELPDRQPESHGLPAGTQWVAIEIGNEITWPPAVIKVADNLGVVIDQSSLMQVSEKIKTSPNSSVAIAVSAIRIPDRGVQRSIATLTEGTGDYWLVLLYTGLSSEISKQRLAAWYQLAKKSAIPADHVLSLKVNESS